MYFLVDGIYPKYAIFQSTGDKEGSEMEKVFSMQQEGVRKDVERVFSVLQTKWQILHRPFRCWDVGDIHDTLEACIIFHNMVVENNVNMMRDKEELLYDDDDDIVVLPHQKVETIFNNNVNATYNERVQAIETAIVKVNLNHDLKSDIMEHMFNNMDNIKLYTV
jgi:hypothetical protein